MADNEWVDVASPNAQQDEWQDVTPQQSIAPKGNMGDMAWDAMGRFGKGAYNATNFLPFMKNKNADQIYGGIPQGKNLGQQIPEAIGSAIPTIAMVNPIARATAAMGVTNPLISGPLAFGSFNAGKATMQGQPIAPAALEGAAQGLAYGVGGMAGTNIANAIAKPLMGGAINPLAQTAVNTAGSALGQAGAGAAMAPEGEKISSAIVGGGLGVLSPLEPANRVTPEQHDVLVTKAGDLYRKILAPGKPEINSVEVKSGKNLDDFYKLAAKEGLIINKTADNKLDTTNAKAQLSSIIENADNNLTDALKNQPAKQFDLEALKAQAKLDWKAKAKTAKDYEDGAKHIDNYMDAEIRARGQHIDGSDLNELKRGMWRTSYDPLQPNSNDAARSIGFTAKDAIEKAYKNDDIKGINSQMGEYATLSSLLDKAHGRVVDKGKLGKYVAQLTGLAVGHHIPIVGDIGGGWLGGKFNEFMTDPSRLTGNWNKKLQDLSIIHPQGSPSNPQVMAIRTMPPNVMGNALGGPISGGALPRPGSGPYNPSQHTVMGQGSIRMGNQSNPGVVSPPNLNRPLELPAPPPKYLQERENIPPQDIPKGQAESSNPIELRGPKRENTMDLFNPLKNAVSPAKLPDGVKALGLAGAVGLGSMFGQGQAQASELKNPERLKMPAADYTKAEEGYQAHPYIDTKGNKTIGYGFEWNTVKNMLPEQVFKGKRGLTKPEADQIFTKLYTNAKNNAFKFAGERWNEMSASQQKSLIDMSYNMGGKLNGFYHMKQAIADGDWQQASKEVLHSNYAKEVPNRAKRNAVLMAQME